MSEDTLIFYLESEDSILTFNKAAIYNAPIY